MLNLLRRLRRNKNGATAIEYGLIGGLIAVSVIVGASQVGDSLGNVFQGHADTIVEANDRY